MNDEALVINQAIKQPLLMLVLDAIQQGITPNAATLRQQFGRHFPAPMLLDQLLTWGLLTVNAEQVLILTPAGHTALELLYAGAIAVPEMTRLRTHEPGQVGFGASRSTWRSIQGALPPWLVQHAGHIAQETKLPIATIVGITGGHHAMTAAELTALSNALLLPRSVVYLSLPPPPDEHTPLPFDPLLVATQEREHLAGMRPLGGIFAWQLFYRLHQAALSLSDLLASPWNLTEPIVARLAESLFRPTVLPSLKPKEIDRIGRHLTILLPSLGLSHAQFLTCTAAAMLTQQFPTRWDPNTWGASSQPGSNFPSYLPSYERANHLLNSLSAPPTDEQAIMSPLDELMEYVHEGAKYLDRIDNTFASRQSRYDQACALLNFHTLLQQRDSAPQHMRSLSEQTQADEVAQIIRTFLEIAVGTHTNRPLSPKSTAERYWQKTFVQTLADFSQINFKTDS